MSLLPQRQPNAQSRITLERSRRRSLVHLSAIYCGLQHLCWVLRFRFAAEPVHSVLHAESDVQIEPVQPCLCHLDPYSCFGEHIAGSEEA